MMEQILRLLRENGWRVAVHNDYRLNRIDMTFWLMTHSSGLFLKGEGISDAEALMQIVSKARNLSFWRENDNGMMLRVLGYEERDG